MMPETTVGMAKIEGIDLAKIAEAAAGAARKSAQAEVERQCRAASVDLFNLRSKRLRHLAEVTAVDENIVRAEQRLARLASGDWTALEPFDVKDKQEPKQEQK